MIGVAQVVHAGDFVGGELVTHHHLEHRIDDQLVLIRIAQHRLGRHQLRLERVELEGLVDVDDARHVEHRSGSGHHRAPE